MFESAQWKTFVAEALKKAEAVLAEDHIQADTRAALKDLVQIAVNVDSVLQSQFGQTADARLLKKRYDQAKLDLKAQEQKVEALKAAFSEIVEATKAIAADANVLVKRHKDAPDDPDHAVALRLKALATRIVEVIVKTNQV